MIQLLIVSSIVFALASCFCDTASAQNPTDAYHQHPKPSDPVFADAVSLLDGGDVDGLKALLAKHPNLVHQRASGHKAYDQGYFKSPTLLHFVAANPNFTGEKLPDTWLDMVRLILDAGAKVDAGCGDDAKGTALGLVVSSRLGAEGEG